MYIQSSFLADQDERCNNTVMQPIQRPIWIQSNGHYTWRIVVHPCCCSFVFFELLILYSCFLWILGMWWVICMSASSEYMSLDSGILTDAWRGWILEHASLRQFIKFSIFAQANKIRSAFEYFWLFAQVHRIVDNL